MFGEYGLMQLRQPTAEQRLVARSVYVAPDCLFHSGVVRVDVEAHESTTTARNTRSSLATRKKSETYFAITGSLKHAF